MPDHDSFEAARAVAPVLTPRERRRTWVLGVVPVVVVTAVVLALALAGRATLGDVVVGAVVYGGLLGLAASVVGHERAVATHCPACDAGGPRGRGTCDRCGYDLAERPLWRCAARHHRYVGPGLCACGRHLHRIEPVRGLDRELRRTLWAGAWVAAFLLGVTLLLPFVD